MNCVPLVAGRIGRDAKLKPPSSLSQCEPEGRLRHKQTRKRLEWKRQTKKLDRTCESDLNGCGGGGKYLHRKLS